jgi:pilus assembly protein CpaD
MSTAIPKGALHRERFRRRASAAAGAALTLALGFALSGCYAPRDTTASIPNDYRQRHPIAIKEGERSVVVFVGSNRGELTPSQRADVLAFAHAWKREATGGIVIDIPTHTPNARAAADSLREIHALFAAAQVPHQAVRVRRYTPSDPTQFAAVKINYSRIIADAGPCGLWPRDLGPDVDKEWLENRPYWNLGCASQRNLAAMVENPSDLVQPRGESPPLQSRRSQVFEKYRKGESTATSYPNKDQGKISDVGK